MSELVAIMLRGIQAALGLFLLMLFIAPVVYFIWPYIWPILLLGLAIGLFGVLDVTAKRLEER